MIGTRLGAKGNSQQAIAIWLGLSLLFAIAYSVLSIQKGLSRDYLVQDDIRVYLIWMQRFVDPDLFPNDLIVDYLKSVTPWGYAALFKVAAMLGIPPLLFGKLMSLVVVIPMTVYAFALGMQILDVPLAGFLGALLLNQGLWIQDDIGSGTPRAFIYPILLAFLYYLVRRQWVAIGVTLLLAGLLYPIGLMIAAGILGLQLVLKVVASRQPWGRSLGLFLSDRRDLVGCGVALGVAILVMLPYVFSESQYGPTVTYAEARSWAEFQQGGRIPFFNDANPIEFWFKGAHSGIRIAFNPAWVVTALCLPFLLLRPAQFPLVKRIKRPHLNVLVQLLLASFAWFFAAHLLLLKLYLPSRYTVHSLVIVFALAGAIALTVLWDALVPGLRRLERSTHLWQRAISLAITIVLVWLVVFFPSIFWGKYFPKPDYFRAESPAVFEFLKTQPKDSRVAFLGDAASNVPIFAQRPVLVASEYGNPYHVGYYRQFKQRAVDLVRAQYTPDLAELKRFIQNYQVAFWIVERDSFKPEYLERDRWLRLFQPSTGEAISALRQGKTPALARLVDRCSVLKADGLVVIPAACIAKAPL